MNGAFWFSVPLLAIFFSLGGDAGSPDAATIVRRSVQASLENYQALPGFNYFKVERRPDGTTRTFEEVMMAGSRYSRLVAVNGKPLSPEQGRDEQRKLEGASRKRAAESRAERDRRVGAYERDRQRDRLLLNELGNAFEFTLVGDQFLDGRDVYVLKARPRPGYRPPSNRAKVLTGMEGTICVDRATFQWVRVEARVVRPVSLEGFLARVHPGTRFQLDQAPVSGNLWLPTHFSMKTQATILLFFSRREEQDETYYGYYPAAA